MFRYKTRKWKDVGRTQLEQYATAESNPGNQREEAEILESEFQQYLNRMMPYARH